MASPRLWALLAISSAASIVACAARPDGGDEHVERSAQALLPTTRPLASADAGDAAAVSTDPTLSDRDRACIEAAAAAFIQSQASCSYLSDGCFLRAEDLAAAILKRCSIQMTPVFLIGDIKAGEISWKWHVALTSGGWVLDTALGPDMLPVACWSGTHDPDGQCECRGDTCPATGAHPWGGPDGAAVRKDLRCLYSAFGQKIRDVNACNDSDGGADGGPKKASADDEVSCTDAAFAKCKASVNECAVKDPAKLPFPEAYGSYENFIGAECGDGTFRPPPPGGASF